MPSSSAAQHRWIGWLHSNPSEARKAGMSPAKVNEWLHADKGSPWKHAGGGDVASAGWANRVLGRNGRPGDANIDPRMTHEPNDMDASMVRPVGRPRYETALRSGGPLRRDVGGSTDPSGGIGGPTPSASNQNPLYQSYTQRFANASTEQLQELAARMGGTPQGSLIQQMLMKRRLMPQVGQQQQQQPMQPGQTQQQPAASSISAPMAPSLSYKKGGGIPKRDMGGGMSLSEMSPWWTRRESSGEESGFLHGVTPGRADQVKTQAPPGAYVIPADVVSGLGEGNSLAGARYMQDVINSGPWGTPLPRMRGRSTIPHPPPLAANERAAAKVGGTIPIFEAKKRGSGGANTGSTPVDLSDGEFVVSPKDCERFGYGDREAGHRWWDDWVVKERKKHIKKLQTLRGPVKS